MMEVLMTTEATRHATLQSNSHHQQTEPSFYSPDSLPVPNQQCLSTEGKYYIAVQHC